MGQVIQVFGVGYVNVHVGLRFDRDVIDLSVRPMTRGKDRWEPAGPTRHHLERLSPQ